MAIWTGKRMVVWGGITPLGDGGLYDPIGDAWSPISTTGAPSPRVEASGVWTGTWVLVWGGRSGSTYFNDGRYYDPRLNVWSNMASVGPPAARSLHGTVYAENTMLIWGGKDASTTFSDGSKFDPIQNAWTPMTDVNKPSTRTSFSALWTGERMLIATGSPVVNETKDYCFVCTPTTWYQDADGDGAGYAPQTAMSCAIPAGYANNTDDCDDTDPNRHLGAPEICDGKDDDCDGNTPANEADGDSDGVLVCANDCNDDNPAVHAGAAEICNGIDDNCSGTTDEDALGVDTDGDTVHNACDNCRTVSNPTQVDTDRDGIGSACDNCALVANVSQADSDSDQRGNACDNCPIDYNPLQDDFDGDHAGDACDNCAFDFNTTQSNVDHDGEGDICDFDDGLIYIFGTDDENYIEWQAEIGPSSWNAYEGDLAVLKATGDYTQAPGSNPLADRQCGLTDPFVQDLVVPTAGKIRFSLVTGVTGGVEGSLGTNSAGVPRPNANPCP